MSFRIKHKPTGLFYRPSRTVKNKDRSAYVKSNLSDKGKSYHTSPSLGWIGGRIYTHLHTDAKSKYIDAPLTDWEIIDDEAPKRPEGLSDDEYAMRTGTEAYLKLLVERADEITKLHDEEHARRVMGEIFRYGVEVVDQARANFELGGAL